MSSLWCRLGAVAGMQARDDGDLDSGPGGVWENIEE